MPAGRPTPAPAWLNSDDHFAYVYGYPDGRVGPLNNITRAEVAAIFYRLLRKDIRMESQTTENSFDDVPADAWYVTEVSTLARLGVFVGRTTDVFAPDAPITRAEFATVAPALTRAEPRRTETSPISAGTGRSSISGRPPPWVGCRAIPTGPLAQIGPSPGPRRSP